MYDIIPQLFVLCFLIGYSLFLAALFWWALGTRLITAVKIRSARLVVQAQKVLRSSIATFRREGRGTTHRAAASPRPGPGNTAVGTDRPVAHARITGLHGNAPIRG